MNDIVERLRESADAWANEVDTRKEAADEIERLRAELKSATWHAGATRVISTKTEPPIDCLKRGAQ